MGHPSSSPRGWVDPGPVAGDTTLEVVTADPGYDVPRLLTGRIDVAAWHVADDRVALRLRQRLAAHAPCRHDRPARESAPRLTMR